MARKGSLTAENLAALGAGRLAALLMELGRSDSSVRKRLVLAVAESGGSEAIIKAVDRRLSALATSRGIISWEKTRAYAKELDGLRDAIAQTLAPVDARAATDRLSRFIRLAPKVLERVDDSGGRFDQIFRAAVENLGTAWGLINDRDPEVLASETFSLIQSDKYDVCDELVATAAPALGEAGLAALADLAKTAMAARNRLSKGRISRRLEQVLGDIADARGDVDAFIALEMTGDGVRLDVLGIASRLLNAERPGEALAWLDRKTAQPSSRAAINADQLGSQNGLDRPAGLEWDRETIRMRALEQLGRRPEAQEVRWRLFEQTLHVGLLRDYIRALPDFEEFGALDRAFSVAAAHRNVLLALAFLAQWPDLGRAAKLAMQRADEIDGRQYELLSPVAEALAQSHPHAATLIYRRMIDSVLERAASRSYPYAAKDLADCSQLADEVDWAAWALRPHSDYLAELRARHGRKVAFWSLVKG